MDCASLALTLYLSVRYILWEMMLMALNEPKLMTIGEVAKHVGLAATALRYYEREGLVVPTTRSGSGYRLYDGTALERLGFIRAAQAVGFTLDDVRALLELDGDVPCKDVQSLLKRRISEVDLKLADLNRVRAALDNALKRCRRSKKGCPILTNLKSGHSKRRS